MIDRPKDGSTGEELIPHHILTTICAHLNNHVGPEPDSLLFADPDTGQTMREWVYRRMFNQACTDIGRPDFRPGEQRHTGGTLAAQAGGTLPEVMERLRHKNPQTAMGTRKSLRDARKLLQRTSRNSPMTSQIRSSRG
ncbi:hypothetical protein AB0I35_05970 [Nocardia sp. NPDC050378]|uniref:hypothetical protein n=1 Tax=Nocardia sp. NPDC050378 TaxID=3155400 RepID=UPI0033E211A3